MSADWWPELWKGVYGREESQAGERKAAVMGMDISEAPPARPVPGTSHLSRCKVSPKAPRGRGQSHQDGVVCTSRRKTRGRVHPAGALPGCDGGGLKSA